MSKLNTKQAKPLATSPVTTTGAATTHEGGAGYARDAKSDLYLLAVTNMVSEATFYEKAEDRDTRFADLVHTVALDDPQWVTGFFPWLRTEGFMRSASVVGAAEAAKALCDANRYDGVAGMIDGALQRADEPGEFLAYWLSIAGKGFPSRYREVKQGLKLAAARLYSERSWLKYDSNKNGYRFADVIQLVHPAPADETQRKLFKYILDNSYRHGSAPVFDELTMLRACVDWRTEVRRVVSGNMPMAAQDAAVASLLDPERLKSAGLTWEDVLSALGSKVNKADLWSSIAPSMGAMALVRNLRNFDEADVSDTAAEAIGRRFSDPEQVKRSKQFPFRFLAAYNSVGSLRWGHYLEKAMAASLANVPELRGRTLILVDRSGSMFGSVSQSTQLDRADSAAIFGTALAMRAQDATLVQYGTSHAEVKFKKGDSLLRTLERFHSMGGTNTTAAVKAHLRGHDRVVIVTDEQTMYGGYHDTRTVSEVVPAGVPLYTWNLAGYRVAHGESGRHNRHTFGGLSDASFRLIPMLESGRNSRWPWQK